MTVTPTQPYNGVLFIHSALNRYEQENKVLHAGPPGLYLKETLASCSVAYEATAAQTVEVGTLPTGTIRVLLFGEEAHVRYCGTRGLEAHRGYVRKIGNIEFISTFNPVDCVDLKNYETDEAAEEDNAANTGKDTAPTSRGNYGFWFRSDISKLLRAERRTTPVGSTVTTSPADFAHRLPSLGPVLFLDIETHPPSNSVQCLAVAGLSGPVLSLACYDHKGEACGNLARAFAALAVAMRKSTVVVHNALFDLPFLAHYHGVPFGRAIQDTMLTHHRFFPESEKSLAHAISYWINAPYHKDEGGSFTPRSRQQFDQLLAYNAKDVATLRAIWMAQRDALQSANRGLRDSVDQVSASIYPYALMALTGIKLDTARIAYHKASLSRKVNLLLKIVQVLTGLELNPGSPVQVSSYFHDKMGYPILEKTDTGAPSTGGDVLYRLKLKYPKNIAIDAILAYRDYAKQLSMLHFERYVRPTSRQ